MNGSAQWQLLWEQIRQTDALSWVAVSLGVAEVLLARANKIALYPAGILGTLLTIYIFYRSRLFAECLLNAYYVVMSVYGWWYWVKRREEPPVPISRSDKRDWLVVLGIVLVGFTAGAYILAHYTTSNVPYWDAWVSSTGWAGMWLLARRKIENWVLLNISNAFAIPLLIYKQLPLYAVLTLFLFIVAISGFIQWRRILRNQLNAGAAAPFPFNQTT